MTSAAAATVPARIPTPEALEVARLIKERLGRRTTAPVRVAFVGAHDDVRPDAQAPALARILRGGRGGEVRLKLELSFLWFAVNPPHDLTYPARLWAVLLGLEDPDGQGARRVRLATKALAEANLIAIEPRPGRPGRILLLEESAADAPYHLPGAAFAKVRGTGEEWRHRYIQIPDALWTNGWLATLSGAALAMLLVLYVELGRRDPSGTDLWFSPAQADRLYGLSEDTRSKGLRELRAAGLITARKRSASRDLLDFRRLRNTYRLELARMSEQASVPLHPRPDDPMPPGRALFER